MKAQLLSSFSGPRPVREAEPEEDGRRLRRDRNRDAVVDALLELYAEGNLDPSAAEVAERAGSSPRSVFRYFDDVADLCQAAVIRQQERVRHLADIDAKPTDPLSRRIDALVASRAALFERIGNVGTVARLRSPFQEVIARELAHTRLLLRTQVAELFAGEIAAAGKRKGPTLLAALDVLCSFESYHLMRHDQGLTRPRATLAMGEALRALLG